MYHRLCGRDIRRIVHAVLLQDFGRNAIRSIGKDFEFHTGHFWFHTTNTPVSHLSYKECFGHEWNFSLDHRTSTNEEKLQLQGYYTRGCTHCSHQTLPQQRATRVAFSPPNVTTSGFTSFLEWCFCRSFCRSLWRLRWLCSRCFWLRWSSVLLGFSTG